MRFVALFKKEFREIVPWILLALSILLLFGGIILVGEILSQSRWDGWSRNAGTPTDYSYVTRYSMMQSVGPLLFLVSLGLGVVIAVRQFWVPVFLRTWAYTLHRSSSRTCILLAKFTAAAAGFIVALGCPWTLIFWYASRPGVFALPAGLRIFVEGWIFILMGLTAYFATALSGLSTDKWYGTKVFPMVFAALALCIPFMELTLTCSVAVVIVGQVIFLPQIFHSFLSREF